MELPTTLTFVGCVLPVYVISSEQEKSLGEYLLSYSH